MGDFRSARPEIGRNRAVRREDCVGDRRRIGRHARKGERVVDLDRDTLLVARNRLTSYVASLSCPQTALSLEISPEIVDTEAVVTETAPPASSVPQSASSVGSSSPQSTEPGSSNPHTSPSGGMKSRPNLSMKNGFG